MGVVEKGARDVFCPGTALFVLAFGGAAWHHRLSARCEGTTRGCFHVLDYCALGVYRGNSVM